MSIAADQRDTVPDWEPWGAPRRRWPRWPIAVLALLALAAGVGGEAWVAQIRRGPGALPSDARLAERRVFRLGEVPLTLERSRRPGVGGPAARSAPPPASPKSLSAQIEAITAHDLNSHLDQLAPTHRDEGGGLSARDAPPLRESLGAELGSSAPLTRRRRGARRRRIDFLAATPEGPGRPERGAIAQDAARRGLVGLEPAVRRCHLLQPRLQGRLSYEIEVSAAGRVVEITEGDDSTLGESRVAHCVARAIERIRLPSEPGRATVLLEYAWDLR